MPCTPVMRRPAVASLSVGIPVFQVGTGSGLVAVAHGFRAAADIEPPRQGLQSRWVVPAKFQDRSLSRPPERRRPSRCAVPFFCVDRCLVAAGRRPGDLGFRSRTVFQCRVDAWSARALRERHCSTASLMAGPEDGSSLVHSAAMASTPRPRHGLARRRGRTVLESGHGGHGCRRLRKG